MRNLGPGWSKPHDQQDHQKQGQKIEDNDYKVNAPSEVLVIAPPSTLKVGGELTAVVNLLGADLIAGEEATASRVLDEIGRGRRIVWFCGHGNEQGIQLAKGEFLTTSSLTSALKTGGVELTVLNSCSSLGVALTMYNEFMTYFVCTLKPIDDEIAGFFGRQFALNLSRGYGYQAAFFNARPGQNQDYIFLAGREEPVNTRRETSDEAVSRLQRIEDEISRLATLMDGSTRWNAPGIVNVLNQLVERVEKLESQNNFLLWMVVALAVMGAATLILAGIAFINLAPRMASLDYNLGIMRFLEQLAHLVSSPLF